VSKEDVEKGAEDVKSRWSKARQPTYKVEAMKAAALGHAASASGSRADVGDSRGSSTELGAVGAQRGVEWGEDMHDLLEAAMRQPGTDLESLARSLTRERDLEDDEDQRVNDLLASVKTVQRSDIWKRAQASERVLAEVPVTMMAKTEATKESPPTVQRGAIDLVFLESGGWVIVDYKTDRVAEDSVAMKVEHYRSQVASYARAWERVVGQPVHEVGLYFTNLNRYERLAEPAAVTLRREK
jgi:ATP-dependent exoDNAse (exonuclease V) beta subunit